MQKGIDFHHIYLSQMQTQEQKALGSIMRTEWPDIAKDIGEFEKYALNQEFLTEPVILKIKNEVIGGNYITNHPNELKKFYEELKSQNRKEENIIVAEFFVIKPEYRNKGRGSQLLKFLQKTYLGERKHGGMVLRSNIVKTQEFYKKHGGIILFDGKPYGTRYHEKWGQTILNKGSVFLYTLDSCNQICS